MAILQRKSISEIIHNRCNFFIPAYQRGYKWTEGEVFKLMYDIWDFQSTKHHSDGDFYCLQPIVVKTSMDGIHVIDGQQRLTTLLIIQQAIIDYKNRILLANPASKSLISDTLSLSNSSYTINYETRGHSVEWLKLRDQEEQMSVNSDFFHIYKAYNLALDFFKWIDKDNEDSLLLGKSCPRKFKSSNPETTFDTCMKDNCYVIWYELESTSDSDAEIFDRLNTGKITLTNAELIKALFLQDINFKSEDRSDNISEDYRTNLAREWDNFEHQLQDSSFWHFIYDKNWGMNYETRIEYILDLISGKTRNQMDRFYYTFDYYDDLYQRCIHQTNDRITFVRDEWKRLKGMMQTLRDWYDNRTYYHYIGFLITQGHSVNEIITLQFPKDQTGEAMPIPRKQSFIAALEQLIRSDMHKYTVKDLYKSKKGLTPTLLLFNVLLDLSSPNENTRYPFHHHKNSIWNEEHVASNNDFEPNKPERAFIFAAQMLEYFLDVSYFEHYNILIKERSHQNQSPDKKLLKRQAIDICVSLIQNKISELKNPLDIEKYNNLLEIFNKEGKDVGELSISTYESICESFESSKHKLVDDENEKDFIWNQALLDEGTNKSYGNAIFPYKRKRIIQNDAKGIFVPPGTKNIFLKVYSNQLNNMFEWDRFDAANYLYILFEVLNGSNRHFLRPNIEEELPTFVQEQLKVQKLNLSK